MPHDPKDMARVWDMLDAVRVVEFTAGLTLDDYAADERRATLWNATRRFSAKPRGAFPRVPSAHCRIFHGLP